MMIFLILAIVLVLVAVHDLLRRPVLRRVALRNLTRRMGEASLVIFGSALGTAIIAGAFIVGDTFDASIRDIARTDRGPIDELVRELEVDELDAAVAAIEGTERIDGVDGIGTLVSIPVAMTGVGDDARGEPRTRITEGDFDALRTMGADISGFSEAGSTPTGDELVITDELGGTLDVEAGDAVQVFAYGMSEQFTVRAVVPHVGIAGFGEAFVAPGTLERLAESSTLDDVEDPRAFVLISNDGGVFDSADNSLPILFETEQRLRDAGITAEVDATKHDLLEDAAAEGDEISEIFIVIGGFSVLAGVLLLVNLFVMLAEERKTSLGVLRAIGWRRNHLVRGFVLEGAAYAAIAGAVGAVLGIGVGWVIVQVTQSIFNSTGSDFGLRLAIEPASLFTAALVGFVISMLVIWVTSVRISRLNIIRAIRDLPEPVSTRWQKLRLVVATVFVALGVALTAVVGVGGESAPAVLAGVPVALFAARTLLVRLLPERPASIAIGLAVIVWSLAVFSVFADIMEDPDIGVFLLQGVLLVGGAVLITSSLGTAWAKLARMLGASGPATQLGMAYPVARRFRTGVSLAMFSLIVFSLTFMAVLTSAFGQQVDTFVAETSAGFDAQVRSNAANPIDADALRANPSIESSATLLQGWPSFRAPFDETSQVVPAEWRVSGIDVDFLSLNQVPALSKRDAEYNSDAAVFEDILTNHDVAVVAEWFLDTDEGQGVELGDVVTLVNTANEDHDLTIVGIMNEDWVFAGTFISADLVRSFLPGEYGPVVQYVQFANGVDPEVGVDELSARYLANGAEAETFDEIVGVEIEEQQGFFNLLSGYLSLGLLIGVAGLGVVMVRAVRERRRQVGMLRAMGLPTPKVRQMFLTEGAFVAVQGVLSGLVLGLLSSYQLLTQSNTFEIQLNFAVPWLVIAGIVLIPLGASALAAAVPARRAANIPPAVALRLAD